MVELGAAMRTSVTAVGLVLCVLCAPAAALAWGDQGHRIICQIAFERLTPAARSLVTSIFADRQHVEDPFDTCPACNGQADDGRFMTFQEGCTWADESRRDTFKGTYEYHFINVPQASATFDLARDCAALDCAVVAIQRYARYVALTPGGSPREKERRYLALRFLGHFVGDLHQPLHVGNVEDLGGNNINVTWDTGPGQVPRKLHAVWDSSILQRAGITEELADGQALNAEITAAELSAWQTFDVTGWAEESLTHARARAYVQANGSPVVNGTLLSDDYFDLAKPVAIERLKQAGVRLAHLINAAAAGTLPVNMLQVSEP
jgi:hypothetical protein